ncbi:MAG TPA: protease modulator HflC [Xanthomonadaceae bacterium]|nr:protease modulator HflC [Xanthomonadaceae bacterium]
MRTLIVALVVIAGLLALNSFFVVKEGETAIRFRFSRIAETAIEPGLHLKLPMVEDVQVFDARIRTLDSEPEPYLTNEKKDVNVDFFAKWRIDDVDSYYLATQGDEQYAPARLLSPVVKEALRNVINQRNLRDVVASERTNLSEVLVAVANEAADGFGIEVVDIRIKRLDLPERVSESVFERMRAERKRVANELRSEGFEAAENIRSNAERERRVIVAEAERDAQRMRGEGDARATEIYAQAYGADPEFYAFHRSLEAYREAFGAGEDVMVLDPESDFFRYFGGPGRNR